MPRLGLLVPEVSGHLNPMTTLGAALARLGHDVTVFAGRGGERAATRAGLGFVRLGDDAYDRAIAEGLAVLGRQAGLAAVRQTVRIGVTATRRVLAELPGHLTSLDGLVVDQVLPVGVVLAERAGLPFCVASNALAVDFDAYAPPPNMLWRYRRDWVGRLRNAAGKAVLRLLVTRAGDAGATGVDPLMLVFESHHGLAHVAQQPALFDFPRTLSRHFHYTAPWHAAGRDDELDFPWERLDGRPLVYASMGTLQNDVPAVFAAIAESVRGLPVQIVLTHGGADGPLTTGVAENVIVVRRAPQLRLLQRATLAITHAGLNSALECLTHGVPMVCLPVTNDQPGVAMRAMSLGVAEVLPVRRLTAARLRPLLQRLLDDPTYRQRSAAIRADLANVDGPTTAAAILDRAFTTGRVVTAEDWQGPSVIP